MLKKGEKGAIPQRDGKTYAIAPHIPCGVVSPSLLRRIADVAEKYQVKALKITGATRIALVGIREEDVDAIWREIGLEKGAAVGLCVRSIRACPGNTYCKLGVQDALGVGMALDKQYHGMTLPNKLKMAVSGCNLNCSESAVRDIGLVGKKDGWQLTIGGNVGPIPRIGQELISGIDDGDALKAVETIIDFYRESAKKGERLGKTLERIGLAAFADAVG